MIIAVSAFAATISGVLVNYFLADRYEQRGWFCFLSNLFTAVAYVGIIRIPAEGSGYWVLAPLFLH